MNTFHFVRITSISQRNWIKFGNVFRSLFSRYKLGVVHSTLPDDYEPIFEAVSAEFPGVLFTFYLYSFNGVLSLAVYDYYDGQCYSLNTHRSIGYTHDRMENEITCYLI